MGHPMLIFDIRSWIFDFRIGIVMNCQQAQTRMNERLDREPGDKPADWSALDAHLAGCPKCARTWLELLRTKQLLANLREDKPTPEELDTMWQAIATTAPFDLTTITRRFERGTVWRFMASTSAIAACLFVALLLGREKYAEMRRHDIAHNIAAAGLIDGADQSTKSAGKWYWSEPTSNERRLAASASTLANAVIGFSDAGEDVDGDGLWEIGGGQRGTARGLVAGDSLQEGVAFANTEASQESRPQVGYETRVANVERGRGYFARKVEQTEELARGDARVQALWMLTTGNEAEGWSDDSSFVASTDADGDDGVAVPGEFDAGVSYGYSVPFGPFSSADSAGKEIRAGSGELTERYTTQVPELGEQVSASDKPTAGVTVVTSPSVDEETSRTDDFFAGALFRRSPGDADGNDYDDGASVFNHEPGVIKSESRAGKGVVALNAAPAYTSAADLASALEAIGTNEPGEAPGERASSASPPAPPPVPVTSTTQTLPASVKIIKTGELSVEVAEYAPAASRVEALVKEHGAFIADGGTVEQAGGALAGTFVIRVAPERFDALFAALKQIGTLESESAKAADVTAQYVDIEARVKSLRITEERLQELIKTKSFIDRVSSLLEVEREMTRVRSEIEQYEGQLRVMADRVALSTITVRLHEPGRIVPGAFLTVEVPALDDAVEVLRVALEPLGARIASGKIEKKENGSLFSKHELRVTLAHYGDALDAISRLGRVTHRDVRDWQPSDAREPWAVKVNCLITLAIREIEYQLPTGEISIEVDDVDDAVAKLESAWAEAGVVLGSNTITRREDGSSVASVELRVPAGAFAAVADRAGEVGRTLSKKTSGSTETITGGAAKQLCRLALTLSEPLRQVASGKMLVEVEAFETGRAALNRLVDEQKVQVLDATSVQRNDGTWMGAFRLGIPSDRIDKVVAGLEGLGRVVGRELRGVGLGELARTNPDALGVIDLTLGEKAALSPGPDRSRDSIRARVRDGLVGLYASLGMIAYGLVVMAPWVVLVIVAGWLITRFWRRRAKKRQAESRKANGK